MRISFDIGGVLSKYPDTFRDLIATLRRGGAEVFVITDIPDRETARSLVIDNGFAVPAEHVLCADYAAHGDRCKEELIRRLQIDMHFDDYAGYAAAASRACVSLLVWPDPDKPYNGGGFVP